MRKVILFLSVFLFVGIFALPVHAQVDTKLDCNDNSPHRVIITDKAACEAMNALFNSEGQTDGPWYNQNPTQFAKKVLNDTDPNEIFGERYTYAQINWIINSIATMLNPAANIDNPVKLWEFMNNVQEILKKTAAGQGPTLQEYAKLGPVGLFAGGMQALYTNPPASGIEETKRLASRILDVGTGVEPALAQGYGYNGLNSGGAVKALWTASRNMAYMIIIIILIASGFLIMFRVKINPQTVVSLQTMIPKLIITLLLVTFSFAIAGLVIDLIYVFIAGFAGFMSLNGIIDDPKNLGNTIGWLTNHSFFSYIFLQIWGVTLVFILSVAIGLGVGTALSGFTTGLGLIVAPFIIIGLTVWLSWNLVKIFIMLVKAYVMLLLQIIIAPLQIMLDLIPGQQGFGPWLRNITAEASVFVVVPIMLTLQFLLSWDPVGNWNLHLTDFHRLGGSELQLPYSQIFGGALGWGNLVTRWIIGFFIFSLTPKIADIIKEILKVPPFKHGTAFNEALGPVKSALSTGAGISAPWINQTMAGTTGGALQPGTPAGEAWRSFYGYGQSRKWWG